MTSGDGPSSRVVEQRLRNRAIEALEVIAAGDDGVRAEGAAEYVELFFDTIDDRSPWKWRTWAVFTAEEVQGLADVHDLLVEACERTPGIDDVEDFIASGWPRRLAITAAIALEVMSRRGRFSEDAEEVEPPGPPAG